jgi:hypothetical protein
MNIAISGSSGFVGNALRDFFTHQGHTVIPLRIRPTTLIEEIRTVLEQSDVVINLSGANILRRWSESYKALLRHSRLDTTQKVVYGKGGGQWQKCSPLFVGE